VADLIEHVPPPAIPGIVYVRAALTPDMLAAYPTAVAWPWLVGNGHFGADLGERLDTAAQSFHCSHDVAFVGWVTPNGRQRAICEATLESVRGEFGERAIVEAFDGFHGHRVADAETQRREMLFTDAMCAARLHLAPASAPGVLRYRVFEALRAARIPVIIDDAVVLPRADVVDWDRIAVHIPSDKAGEVGPILARWLEAQDPADLIARCQAARTAWLRAFDGRRQDQLFAEVARTKILDALGPREA